MPSAFTHHLTSNLLLIPDLLTSNTPSAVQSKVLEVLRRHARPCTGSPKVAGVRATSTCVATKEESDEDDDEYYVVEQELECEFEDGWGQVKFSPGPVKTVGRMRDKLHKYVGKAVWPLAASILDPVRCTVVCSGPARMAEVVMWLLAAGEELPAVRLRNKFSWPIGSVEDGYRDVNVNVVATHPAAGLGIIGEIQVGTLFCCI